MGPRGLGAGVLTLCLLAGCSGGPPATSAAVPSPPAAASPRVDTDTPPGGAADEVRAPDAGDADVTSFDTRILGLHAGGEVLWVVRRAADGRGGLLHRVRDGVDLGATELDAGAIVSDAVGDTTGLWVATGGPELVHLDAATGAVDRRVPSHDAEWVGRGADDTVVVAGPPASGRDGVGLTVVDGATGEVRWSREAPRPDWTALVDVAWLADRVWMAHFALEDRPDDVRGGVVSVGRDGDVVDEPDLELRHLVAVDDRLVGVSELLSLRQGGRAFAAVVGPGPDDLEAVALGRDDDLVVEAPAPAPGAAWILVEVAADGPRVVRLRTDGTVHDAVRLPVGPDRLVEDVAVVGGDLWFSTAGPDMGEDGDLETALWRLPGAAR